MISSEAFRSAFMLDAAHPNARRWQRAIDGALRRGDLVRLLLAREMELHGARVLDAGAGVGGTSAVLLQAGARVTAIDKNTDRIMALRQLPGDIRVEHADASRLPFQDASFDVVILQDMIEHCADASAVLHECRRVLAPGGIMYLSTPNRLSIFNIMADPHWGLPIAALLKRKTLRKVLRVFRATDAGRDDLAQLLSWRALSALLRNAGFDASPRTSAVTTILFTDPDAVIWSGFHHFMLRCARVLQLQRILPRLAHDNTGLLHRAIVPAWHLLCRKTPA